MPTTYGSIPESAYYDAIKPFEETSEFRDFMIWLCGFTDRGVPSEEDWLKLRDKTKLIAAKFATDAHDRALHAAKTRSLDDWYDTQGSTTAVFKLSYK